MMLHRWSANVVKKHRSHSLYQEQQDDSSISVINQEQILSPEDNMCSVNTDLPVSEIAEALNSSVL